MAYYENITYFDCTMERIFKKILMQKIKNDKRDKRNVKRKIGWLKSCKRRQQRRAQ